MLSLPWRVSLICRACRSMARRSCSISPRWHVRQHLQCAPSAGVSDAELAIAATVCRTFAYQEGQRAKKIRNPTTAGPLRARSQRFAPYLAVLSASPVLRQVILMAATQERDAIHIQILSGSDAVHGQFTGLGVS